MPSETPIIKMPAAIKQRPPQPKTVLVWGNEKCVHCRGGGIHRTVKPKGVMLSVCPIAYIEVQDGD